MSASTGTATTPERRKVVRQKSFLSGRLYFNNRRTAVDCLIRDISIYGARLTFSSAITTPDVIELYIPQKEQTLRSRVIWRYGQELGVAFIPAAQLDQPGEAAGDLAERVQRLEHEVASLKRQLRHIKSDTHEFEPD